MRKKIIISIGIIVILGIGICFGRYTSDNPTISASSQLKDQYKNSVNEKYAENFKQCSLYTFKLYNNLDTMTKEDLSKSNDLSNILLDSKDGSTLTTSELALSEKIASIDSDISFYYLGSRSDKDKSQMKKDMQIIISLYK